MNTLQPKDDYSSWPSRYYGRTRHLDLEKIYAQVLAKSMQEEVRDGKKKERRVRISTEEPTVYEYEPEYDTDDLNRPSPSYLPIDPALVARMLLEDEDEEEENNNMTAVVYRPSCASISRARSLKRLDLRPVRNPNYQRKATPPSSVTGDDDAGSVSSTEPVTPDDPFPGQPWSTTANVPSAPPPPAPRKIDVVRLSINRIRSTSWMPKKVIQKVL